MLPPVDSRAELFGVLIIGAVGPRLLPAPILNATDLLIDGCRWSCWSTGRLTSRDCESPPNDAPPMEAPPNEALPNEDLPNDEAPKSVS